MHNDISTIGARIAEERQRQSASQKETAALGHVSLRTQAAYEMGESMPNLAYMKQLAAAGFDVTYIITGERVASTIADDEAELLARYRGSSLELRKAALAVLGIAAQAPATGSTFNASSGNIKIGQVSHGPITGSQTINVGGGGRKKKGKTD
ncbi:helix-turn-helix domain-containing protein [Lysobacter firmicutimachus]|uniref:Helix-turn-helix domain-containing protein n=1 Tax=Lysobacter firmicutimachus TaxID=1792846 RepID=A0ABU8D0P1_9GAMM